MRGISKVVIGVATILIAIFTLFWLFDNIQKIADKCKEDISYSPACSQLNSFTLSMLIILLIIGGFVVMITATAYILLSG
jgi:D-alanyl-lipoteichoic acid acyltransferase DltB (MBOAT superfamily)